MSQPDLSIVLPTCNRAALLRRSLLSITNHTRCRIEVIVVDGASSDDTPMVLAEARQWLGSSLRVIREDDRSGFVRAANRGFALASGRNLCWLDDDARPTPGALDLAMRQVDHADEQLGFVAMFHRWHSTWNVAYEIVANNRTYRLCHIRGTLYANFPVGRRSTFEQLGFFDERFRVSGADVDLSLKAWDVGLRVEPAYLAMIDHDEVDDDRRAIDSPLVIEDNRALFEKWDLPQRTGGWRNEFDPQAPCTLRGLRRRPDSSVLAA
jgi:GT2 family glycosyltransferase